MNQSQLFSRTLKDTTEETSSNAVLLARAGFIHKTMAGVYTLLPLGLRVVQKICAIVRTEMETVGGQELLMPTLQPKELWQHTGRWDGFDALFKVTSRHKTEYALGPTHEEIITPLAKTIISSYRDLPKYVYQIHTKLRDEPRAKSGILRGKEFLMKDFYSFHENQKDLEQYYDKMRAAYRTVFSLCDLIAIETVASGGSFSDVSHEYQVVTDAGEDTIIRCQCGYAVNQEIVKNENVCEACKQKNPKKEKAIEVGNIFKLNTKFSDAFDLTYTDAAGKVQKVYMGCYGIGITRLMGAVVETHHDDAGIMWPMSLAPFDVHLVPLGVQTDEMKDIISELQKILTQKKQDYLLDDRGESAGTALADADLIGIPLRVVVSDRSVKSGGVEVKMRNEKHGRVMDIHACASLL